MKLAYKAAQSGYEKLQLFRIVFGVQEQHTVVQKYINESFHIENEFIMQLNPTKYDATPEHLVQICDAAFA